MSRTDTPFRNRTLKLVAAAALTAGLATGFVGGAVAPAGAASGWPATLEIERVSQDRSCVHTSMLIPMNLYDAQGYLNNGAYGSIELWGDDPVYDDYLHGSGYFTDTIDNSGGIASLDANVDGIVVYWSECMPNWRLNEDWGGDELYATITVIDGGGGALADYEETNRVNGSW